MSLSALGVFGASFFASLVITSLLQRGATPSAETHADRRARRWSDRKLPDQGGFAIYLCLMATLATELNFATPPSSRPEWHGWHAFVPAITLMFWAGMVDDRRSLSIPTKLVAQFAAAIWLVANLGPGLSSASAIAATIVAVLFLVLITNAFNLIDNMDGSLAGVSAIIAGTLALNAPPGMPTELSAALAGSSLGFLIFNFPPARIYLGNSGSYAVGFTLGALGLVRGGIANAHNGPEWIVLLTLFAVPLLDTAFVICRRLCAGRPIAQGGADHLNHELARRLGGERWALAVLYAVAVVLNCLELAPHALPASGRARQTANSAR